MTEDRHQRLAIWFDGAARLTGPERDAWLERCRAEEPELFDELCELLDYDARDGEPRAGDLDSGLAAALAAEVLESAGQSAPEGEALEVGALVGPYTVRARLGAGGFAVVYRADQREPVRRDVALKVLRPGMNSRHVLSRFAAELQAQARMSHEHVARVYDAGTTQDGRPYLAMELVPGSPITAWCEAHDEDLAGRLTLFLQACDAVQHAHQKGVIHRDLKPSNVLVTDGGEHGSVKIIDFGIAKAIEGSLTEDSLRTLEGQLIGTPEYMSPEQAGRTATEVDTRTDVYSLGVLLYELVAGVRPFDFAHMTLYEIQRTIHEVDPPRPSTRLALVGSRKGLGDPAALARELRGDLDWIVMRALEKDPARRYATAAALAADVQRYLRSDPVEASPPSTAYLLRKFVRRHRGQVAAAGMVVVALVIGLVWALVERERASQSARAETLAKNEAQQRADDLQVVSDFQQSQFSSIDAQKMGQRIRKQTVHEAVEAMQRALVPAEELAKRTAELEALLLGANFTDVAVDALDTTFLETSIRALEKQFADSPAIEAHLLHSAAASQKQLGLWADSVTSFERAVSLRSAALGPLDPLTLWSRIELAESRRSVGDYDRSEAEFAELIEILRVAPQADPTQLARALRGQTYNAVHRLQWERVEALAQEAYRCTLASRGADGPETFTALHSLAKATTDAKTAEAHFLAAIEGMRRTVGVDDAATLVAEEDYASFLERQGRTRETLEIRRRTLEAFRRTKGSDHPSTLVSMGNLGLALWRADQLVEAEQLIRESWEGRLRAHGPDHPNTLISAGDHAMLLSHLGRMDEAIQAYEAALVGMRVVNGIEQIDTLGTMTNLGLAYADTGRLEEAAAILEESLAAKRRVLGIDHEYTKIAMHCLSGVYAAQGRTEAGRALYGEHLALIVAVGESPAATAEQSGYAAERLFGSPYPELRDVKRAVVLAEKALALEREHGGARVYMQLSRLAAAQSWNGDPAAALESQKQALASAPESQRATMQSQLAHYQGLVDRRDVGN